MSIRDFTDRDIRELEERGIALEEAQRQLALFRDPPPFAVVDRPCTVGDGITAIPDADHRSLLAHHADAAASGRVSKFVPASGAASRMFKTLAAQLADAGPRNRNEVEARARGGDDAARDTLRLMDEIGRFAFADAVMTASAAKGDHISVLRRLLTSEGLGYGSAPKGLILFHRYADGPRTAFEEHLVEAEAQIRSEGGRCRVHFTISPEHRAGFTALLGKVTSRHDGGRETRHDVEFSVQDPATDTIAVTTGNEPFRTESGALLLRPAGHGALIRNLGALDADIVLIKNIDNVVMDHLKGPTHLWKRLLVGLYCRIEHRCHSIAAALESSPSVEAVEAALRFVETDLGLDAAHLRRQSPNEASRSLLALLDRPLRIAGVVRNEGEPGGGPFWVRGRDGSVTPQIVEGSQIDPRSAGQQALRAAATHFNPVDLVCGVRDRFGNRFDLTRFIDHDTVFISHKSQGGRDLKALEVPGLWNGAMAYWNTIFVEVPIATFAPVKTVFDLLRPEHQPPGKASTGR